MDVNKLNTIVLFIIVVLSLIILQLPILSETKSYAPINYKGADGYNSIYNYIHQHPECIINGTSLLYLKDIKLSELNINFPDELGDPPIKVYTTYNSSGSGPTYNCTNFFTAPNPWRPLLCNASGKPCDTDYGYVSDKFSTSFKHSDGRGDVTYYYHDIYSFKIDNTNNNLFIKLSLQMSGTEILCIIPAAIYTKNMFSEYETRVLYSHNHKYLSPDYYFTCTQRYITSNPSLIEDSSWSDLGILLHRLSLTVPSYDNTCKCNTQPITELLVPKKVL